MPGCGIVSSSTFADAQIQVEPDETVHNEPLSSGILDEPGSKSSRTPSHLGRVAPTLLHNGLSVLMLIAFSRRFPSGGTGHIRNHRTRC
jgi:hypothetical protein